jgi:hypothetical protein
MATAIGLLATSLLACNDRPVDKLDDVVTAVNRQENRLPAKTKLDFLFVVDNSGSMCEEQDNLTRNFQAFSDFLFEELDASADYRIAIISTDMNDPGQSGRFLNTAAPPVEPANCMIGAPNTADCPAAFDPIIRADQIGQDCDPDDDACFKADLELQFRCHATLGTNGYGFEKGLESMRTALSCGGPNTAMFEQCCVGDVYNPACQIPDGSRQPCAGGLACPDGEACESGVCRLPEPEFLRPDAILAVIITSDEDDCSDPASNPGASRRVICRPGGTADTNGDGLPDLYQDPNLCPDRDPTEAERQACVGPCASGGNACAVCLRGQIEQSCFVRECGKVPCAAGADPANSTCRTADDCRAGRCEIDESANSNCEWYRSNLTPVSDYYRFLVGLKAKPSEQLLIASIVGHRDYTELGSLITYNQPTQVEQNTCLNARRAYEADRLCPDDDCPGVGNSCTDQSAEGLRCTGEGAEAFCCPNGACVGTIQTSCESANGSAFAGRRYLELSELFQGNGIGCNEGTENTGECVHICVDDFAGPLEEIRAKVAKLVGTYCLDKPPSCQVATPEGPRDCETAEERMDVNNYLVQVKIQCLRTEDQVGKCQEILEPQVLPRASWNLILDAASCPGGAQLELSDPPPAGADVFVEFVVDVARQTNAVLNDAGPSQDVDAGAPAN